MAGLTLKMLAFLQFHKHKGHGNLLTAFKKVLASFVSFFNSKKDRCKLNLQMAPQAIWLPGFLLSNWQNLRPAKAFSVETAVLFQAGANMLRFWQNAGKV